MQTRKTVGTLIAASLMVAAFADTVCTVNSSDT